MESKTFHKFSSLPPELRHRVWDLAVRPLSAEGHLHKFIIVYHHFGSPAYNPHPISGSLLKLHQHNGYKLELAVPWDHPERGTNDSVYAVDHGMWMACRDSRAAMEKAFQMNEWWSELEAENSPKRLAGPGKYFRQEDASHSASYIDRDGQETIITIRPNTDIVHLDALGLACVDWFYSYAADTETILDYRGHESASPKPSFLGSNIAVDYDTVMLDILEGRLAHRCFTKIKMHSESIIEMINLIHDECERTLWFIDPRLRPRSVDPAEPQPLHNPKTTGPGYPPRAVFRSGEAEFIEVAREDMENWELDIDEWSTNSKTVFDFFYALAVHATPRLELHGTERLKVLACRPFSTQPRKKLPQIASETRCPTCHPPSPARRNMAVKEGQHLDDIDDVLSLSDFNLFD